MTLIPLKDGLSMLAITYEDFRRKRADGKLTKLELVRYTKKGHWKIVKESVLEQIRASMVEQERA